MKNTIEFGRTNSAINQHKDHSFAIAMREAYHNSNAYGAKNQLLLSFEKFSQEQKILNQYCCLAHDGEPFSSPDEMFITLHVNKSGGKGQSLQGSGGKMSTYPLSGNVLRSEYIVHSKTPNGTASFMYRHISEIEYDVIDVSKEFNGFIENLFGSEYNKYSVFYIYRYDPSLGKTDGGTITTMNNIYDYINITPSISIDGNVNIKYFWKKKHKEGDVIDMRNVSIVDFSIYDKYKFKSYEIEVKNAKYSNDESFSKEKDIFFNAKIKIDVYPNILDENGYIVPNNGQTPEAQVTPNNIFSNYLYVYHDGKVGSKRANIDPFYFNNKHKTSFLYTELGIERPESKPYEIDKEKDFKYVNPQINNYERWLPVIILHVEILNVKNPHNDLGSIDPFFYAYNDSKVRHIVKSIFTKARLDDSIELQNYRTEFKYLLPETKLTDVLPIDVNVKGKSSNDIRVRLTEKGLEQSKQYKNWKKHPTKPEVISSIPININGIEVMLEDIKTQKFINDEVIPTKRGIYFKKNPIEPNVYDLYVDKCFHYDENDNKVMHSEAEHNSLLSSHFPKKQYDLEINGERKKLGLHIEVPVRKGGFSRESSSFTTEKESKDMYIEILDKPDILVKWNMRLGRVELNRSNETIKKLTSKKDIKFKSKLSEVYDNLCDIGFNIYKDSNIIDKYGINTQNIGFYDKYEHVKEYILNELVKEHIKVNPCAIELIDQYEKNIDNEN